MSKKAFLRRGLAFLLTVLLCFGLIPFDGIGRVQVKADVTEIPLVNGSFETDIWAEGSVWTVTTDWDDSTTVNNKDSAGELNFWKANGGTITLTQTMTGLEAGSYELSADVRGEKSTIAFIFDGKTSETALAINSGANEQVSDGKFILESGQDVTIGFVLTLDAGGWGFIDNVALKYEASDTGSEDGGETEEGYRLTVEPANVSASAGDTISLTAKLKYNGAAITDLTAADLNLWWWTDTWNDHTDGNSDAVYSDATGKVLAVDVTVQSEGTYYIVAELKSGDNKTSITKVVIPVTVSAAASGGGEPGDTAVEGDLNITKIENLPDDFIMGMDISSVISEFNSGVTYKDEDGNTIDNVTDFCKLLKTNGITHIRVRVWNDPYDSDGNGYGGGNCDVATAAEIAEGCRAAGLKMLIDFHCSDFWADPGKQQTPKAWAGYTLDEKKTALAAFIGDALDQIDPGKDTVAMVQVGNETTGGFVGESGAENMCSLFSAGASAVRAYNPDVKVVIHVTNPEKGNVTRWAANLATYNVDYDIIATSYYPYWHGTLANLKSQFDTVRSTYGKDVMVAETSYAYTLSDTDGHDNTVRVGNNDSGDNVLQPFSVQGQATAIRNLMDIVNQAGGLGVFYWEPAWITVGDTTGLEGEAYDARVAANKEIWEKYGSGWAASYAGEYDSKDAGVWYGGSAVDCDAMFYPDGTPTAALHVWNYVKTGAVSSDVYVDSVIAEEETIEEEGSYTLPAAITVNYNTGSAEETVSWNAEDINKIDTAKTGTYVVNGTVTFSKKITSGEYEGKTTCEITYTLKVIPKNLIEDAEDAGFEKGDNFTISGDGISSIPAKDDPYAGKGSMHWWNSSATQGIVTYNKAVELAPGEYAFEVKAQGFAGDKVTLEILDENEELLFEGSPEVLEGWTVWKSPKVSFELDEKTAVKLRVVVDMQDGGWGTADAMYLYKLADIVPEETTTEETTEASTEESKGNVETGADVSEGAPAAEIASQTEDNLLKLIFSEEEQKKIAAGKKADIRLSIADISKKIDTAEKNLIDNASQGYVSGICLDLTLSKQVGDAARQPIHELSDTIEISVTLPDELKNTDSRRNRVYKVVRIHEGVVAMLDAVYDAQSNKLSFKTDAFSTYAIVYRDEEAQETSTPNETQSEQTGETTSEETETASQEAGQATSPSTGGHSPMAALIVSVLLLMGAVVFWAEEKLRKTRRM